MAIYEVELPIENARKNQEQLSWSELADLTHAKQVEMFNWCSCEEQEQFPYDDCPRVELCGDCLYPMSECTHG
jgi:hypothetical protein